AKASGPPCGPPPLPPPAPPARHARHAFVKQVLKARCSEAAPRRPRSSGYEIAREVPGEVGSARSLGADDVRVPEVPSRPGDNGVAVVPSEAATPAWVMAPRQTLTPRARAAFSETAAAGPLSASSSTYGSVAFVSAKVEVRGTRAGRLATP